MNMPVTCQCCDNLVGRKGGQVPFSCRPPFSFYNFNLAYKMTAFPTTTITLRCFFVVLMVTATATTKTLTAGFSFSSMVFPSPNARRIQLKKEILSLSNETKRGLIATEGQKEAIEEKFKQLEKLNPTPKPLLSNKVNGDWSLEYTTSDSILGKGGSPRIGPIVQKIDTVTKMAENSEVVQYFGWLPVGRKITAQLIPQTAQFTDVQFKQFTVGPVSFKAPSSFKGSLDVTYVDDELRLSRGNGGNIFVLTRM